MNPQAKAKGGKVRTVMHEFGQGKLKSSSGQKVTNPKQAIAIALSEQRRAKGMQVGGSVDYEKLAKQERDAAKKQQSPTPTPAEAAKMREQAEEAKRNEAERKAPTTKTEMGKKLFARGGVARAMINKQDTRHGKMDMPFSQLNRYAGMRHGGSVKKYAGGGHLENLNTNQSFGSAFREARKEGVKTFTWRGKKYTTEMAGSSKHRGATELKDTQPYRGATELQDVKPKSDADFQAYEYRQGGKVKEAQMEMRHANAMKKAGLPKKMVREEMSEAKKYAKGGGIESRGKTKGTVIRMASGGSVRGSGCEMRGKTKGRMV